MPRKKSAERILAEQIAELTGVKPKSVMRQFQRKSKTGGGQTIKKQSFDKLPDELKLAAENLVREEKQRKDEAAAHAAKPKPKPKPKPKNFPDKERLIQKLNSGKMAVVRITAAFDFADSDTRRNDKIRSVNITVLNNEIEGLLDIFDDFEEMADYLANHVAEGAFMDGAIVRNIRAIEVL